MKKGWRNRQVETDDQDIRVENKGHATYKGFFSFLRGLRRECAIPCHVASENKKGEFSFILEGVKAQGRQKGPHRFCRAKEKGFHNKRGRSIKGKRW